MRKRKICRIFFFYGIYYGDHAHHFMCLLDISPMVWNSIFEYGVVSFPFFTFSIVFFFLDSERLSEHTPIQTASRKVWWKWHERRTIWWNEMKMKSKDFFLILRTQVFLSKCLCFFNEEESNLSRNLCVGQSTQSNSIGAKREENEKKKTFAKHRKW